MSAINLDQEEVKVPLLEISKGNVPGNSPVVIAASNVDVNKTTPETIWKSNTVPTWVPFTSAQTVTIVSTVAADSLSGTGAQILILEGVDANNDLQTETIEMNGVTNVISSSAWLGINPSLITAGSGQTNAGIITITATTDGTLQGIIAIGDSLTSQIIFHIPKIHTLYIDQVRAQVYKSTGGGVEAVVNGFSNINGTRYNIYEVDLTENVEPTDMLRLHTYAPIPGPSYIFFEADVDTNGTTVRCAIEGILVKDGF